MSHPGRTRSSESETGSSSGTYTSPADVRGRVLELHPQVLGVERVALERELGVELALVAEHLVERAVGEHLGLGGLVGEDVPPELERVEELERSRRVDLRVVPLEPHVHVDVVGVRLEVELLDVVDQRAHPDDIRLALTAPGFLVGGPALGRVLRALHRSRLLRRGDRVATRQRAGRQEQRGDSGRDCRRQPAPERASSPHRGIQSSISPQQTPGLRFVLRTPPRRGLLARPLELAAQVERVGDPAVRRGAGRPSRR